jgi:membrane protease YdiL (CAAX protease family)
MKKEIAVKTLPFVFIMVGVCIPLWDFVKFLEYKKVFDPAIETREGKISFYIIFLSVVLIAPFIEELTFRYPLQKVKINNKE